MNKEKEEAARLQEIAKKKGEILEVFRFYYSLFKRGTEASPELILGNVKKALENGLVTHDDLEITVTQFDLLFSDVSKKILALKNLLIEMAPELNIVEKYHLKNHGIDLSEETVKKIHQVYSALFPPIDLEKFREIKNLLEEIFVKKTSNRQ